jgi:glycosyltransferase involved in cell wall biosynthesis
MEKPLVSICIPSYNASEFIEETLKSCLNQSYRNIEIIITDDCSDDNTIEKILSFEDSRIKLIRNEQNLGVQRNWNKALMISSGKYCKVMGADDIIYPDCIEEQVKVLENPNNSDVVLVTSYKDVINQNGKKIISRKFPVYGKINGIKAIKKSLHRGTNMIGEPVAGLFRKEILEKSGYYGDDNLYMIDMDLWCRILKYGNLYVIDKYLYSFRISTNSLSTNLGLKQVKLFYTFVNKLYKDKSYNLGFFDVLIAKTAALLMGIARNAIYLIHFRKK